MGACKKITQQEVRLNFSYNSKTGEIFRISCINKFRIGVKLSDYDRRGYLRISLGYRKYKAHRIAWIYEYGDIPDGLQVDHIDGNKSNNAISNLRLCNNAENSQNERKARVNNKSGYLGVVAKPDGKFASYIKTHGKTKYLGLFSSAIDAHAAYLAEKANAHPFGSIAGNTSGAS